MNKITSFRGKYNFLSNFHPSPMKVTDAMYWVFGTIPPAMQPVIPTAEHLFQSFKARFLNDALLILTAETPKLAKSYGRSILIRPGWNKYRLPIMKKVLRQKFWQNQDLLTLLLATGDAELIEGNHWHDTFFGRCFCEQCKGKGHNHLGLILMEIREEGKEW